MSSEIKDLELWVLSGGNGTRLAPVWSGRPKVLAPVRGRPYFDWFLSAMESAGFSRFRFLLGMGSEQVIAHILQRSDRERMSWHVEEEPLGTGGSVKNAISESCAERFFLANGDSFCPIDYEAMLRRHLESGAVCTMALTRVLDTSDYGRVDLAQDGRVTSFFEKDASCGEGLVNAGVYVLERSLRRFLPSSRVFSLERDVFPKIAENGGLMGFESEGGLVDIGTPERLKSAQEELARLIRLP